MFDFRICCASFINLFESSVEFLTCSALTIAYHAKEMLGKILCTGSDTCVYLSLGQTHFLSMGTVWGTRSMYTNIGQSAGLCCAVCSSSQYCRQVHLVPAVTSCIKNT
jgi:hypothetical protein